MPVADTHTLRLKSELLDLRVGYVNRHFLCFARRNRVQILGLRRQNKNPDHMDRDFVLEVQAGFEPADNGVADRGLTTWLLHQIFDCFNIIAE